VQTVPPPPRLRIRFPLVLPLLVALAIAWLAYDNGSFGLERRDAAGIAVWWIVILGMGLGFWRPRLRREAVMALGATLALALWTLASTAWSPSAEASFNEFDRVTLYLGVALVGALAGRGRVQAWLDGIAGGIVVIAAIALVSRFVPGTFSTRGLSVFLPGSQTRLSFPLGYWNGLAIFVGLAVPLLVGRAAQPGRTCALARATALAALPAVAAVVYLASSRGGVVVVAVGALVLFVLAEDRWAVVAALVVGGAASAMEIAWLAAHHTLVDGPLGSSTATAQGHRAVLVTLALCAGTALVWAAIAQAAPAGRPPRLLGRALVALAVAAALLAAVASHPRARFESFKEPPGAASFSSKNFVGPHLLSGTGSGRWQFWGSAVDEWRSAPLIGRGAGSFTPWWAQHAPISYYIKDAHSLYLQTLGELGLVGGALVAALVLAGVVAGVRKARSPRNGRSAAAAACAAFVAWAVGAGIDWTWQLPAVAIAGMLLLGLLVTAPKPVATAPERGGGLGPVVLTLLAAWFLIIAQAVPFAARLELNSSQAAVRSGSLAKAYSRAHDARAIQPWAASAYLQLALVSEQQGNLALARRWIDSALRRSGSDWQHWLVAARIRTESGEIPAARAALHRARALNPRSPLFQGLGH